MCIHKHVKLYIYIYIRHIVFFILNHNATDSKKPLCNETVMRCRVYCLLASFPGRL